MGNMQAQTLGTSNSQESASAQNTLNNSTAGMGRNTKYSPIRSKDGTQQAPSTKQYNEYSQMHMGKPVLKAGYIQ